MYNLGFAQPATTLVPSFSISAEYNDNIFSQSRDREGDFLTRIQPRLELTSRGRRTDLTANYGPGYEYLAKNPRQSRQFHNLSFGLTHRYSPKLNLVFSDSFSLAPTTVPLAEVRLAEVEVTRTMVTRNSFLARAAYQLTPATATDFSLAYSLTRFEEAQFTDSDYFSISSGISHQLTRKVRVNGNLRFLFLSPEGSPDTSTFSFSLGTNYQYSPTLMFFSNLGQNFSSTAGTRRVGLFTANGLRKTFRTSTLTLSYGRDLTTGTGVQGASTAQRGSIVFNHQLTREAKWDVGLTYSSSKLEVRGGGETKAAIATAGFNQTFGRYTSLRIFYSFTLQEETRATTRIRINRIGAILQFTLPSLI